MRSYWIQRALGSLDRQQTHTHTQRNLDQFILVLEIIKVKNAQTMKNIYTSNTTKQLQITMRCKVSWFTTAIPLYKYEFYVLQQNVEIWLFVYI